MLQQAHVQGVASYPTDVVANLSTIPPLSIGNFRGGSVAGSAAATLTYYGSITEGGTYHQMTDAAGTALQSVKGASESCAIPEAVFLGARWIKIVNNAAQEDMDVTLKS